MNKELTNGERLKDWFAGGKIDELAFLEYIRGTQAHFRYCGGVFYDQYERPYEDSEIQDIFIDVLKEHISCDLCRICTRLLGLAKIRWRFSACSTLWTDLHLANGTLDLTTMELKPREFSLRRLPVAFNPEAAPPSYFLSFLEDLLEEEDIRTLQEYLGYCLVPTNRAQKMLMLVGRGGEGKSTLGRVLAAVFGRQAMMGSIQKICTNRFARADLENRLLLIDDDMSMEALPETSYLKTLVTLEGETDLERKGQQSYQGRIYARFLGFTNGSLSALYDRSEGFYRRQLVLSCKDRPRDRIDHVTLAEKMIREKEGILVWCLTGLARLIRNDYQFTVSAQTKRNLEDARRESNSAMEFLESEGYIVYDKGGCASSKALCSAYRSFCEDNSLPAISDRSFQLYLRQNADRLGLTYTVHLPTERTRSIRGYEGIRVEPNRGLRLIC